MFILALENVPLINLFSSYQKEAIDFIFKRETGQVPSELSLWKYNTTDADEPL